MLSSPLIVPGALGAFRGGGSAAKFQVAVVYVSQYYTVSLKRKVQALASVKHRHLLELKAASVDGSLHSRVGLHHDKQSNCNHQLLLCVPCHGHPANIFPGLCAFFSAMVMPWWFAGTDASCDHGASGQAS